MEKQITIALKQVNNIFQRDLRSIASRCESNMERIVICRIAAHLDCLVDTITLSDTDFTDNQSVNQLAYRVFGFNIF